MKSKIINRVREREQKIAVLHAREKFAGLMAEINGDSTQRPGPITPAREHIERVKASVIETARRELNNTGHCTVRELVLEMVIGHMGDTCEMAFPLPDGRRVNVEVRITKLEGDEVELP